MAAIANQNGHHMVQHVLLPVNIHFHWNIFIFEFLTIYFYFFYFYIVGHFENLKTKSTILSDDLFLCQVSNGSAVRFPLNIFCTFVTMTTAAILNFFNTPELQISCVFAFFTLWKWVKTHVLSDQSVHITHTYCCVSKLSKFGAYLYNTFLSLRNSP